MRQVRPITAGFALTACLLALVSGCKDKGTNATALSAPAPAADDVQTPVNCLPTASADSVDGWTYTAYVSRASGLVVEGLRFGPRLVADQLSVPYLRPVGFGTGFGHLTARPDPADGDLTSTLAGDPVCNPGGHPGVSATYQVTSASRGLTFLVQQSYRFDPYDPATRCEASLSADCARFWPTVTWGLLGSDTVDESNRDIGLAVVQRLQFDPDGITPGSANITRDFPSRTSLFKLGELGAHGMLMQEGALVAISAGHVNRWENWHQTFRPMVTLPGLPSALGGSGYAGCSECVHAHWSWFGSSKLELAEAAQTASCHSAECWTDRSPQILPGSHQQACAAWVRASVPVTSIDWCARAKDGWDGDSLDPAEYSGPLALYWDESATGATAPGSGVTINGTRMRIGDASWPQLAAGNRTTGKLLGQTGAMFVVPARRMTTVGQAPSIKSEVQLTTEPAYENKDAGSRLPAGWVVPVVASLTAADTEQGPFYLRVHADGLTVRNAAGGYTPAGTGEPWVDVYADNRPDANARTPRVLEHAGTAPPLRAYVVFDQAPTQANHVSYELDAAPDGVARSDYYEAATGRWPSGPDMAAAVYFPAGFPCVCSPVIEPTSLTLTGDSSEWLSAIRWSTWTAQSATGTAVHNLSCKSFCAPGQPQRTQDDVSFTLDTPIALCGRSFYSRISTTDANGTSSQPEIFLTAENLDTPGTDCTEPPTPAPPPFPIQTPPGDAAFTTPSGNITCFNASVGNHLTAGAPLPPITQQTVSCYVAEHEWLTTGCTFSNPGVIVSVNGYGQAESTACSEGSARYQPTTTSALAAGYGEVLNMGPALCTVTTAGVKCVSRSAPTHGFQVARNDWSQF